MTASADVKTVDAASASTEIPIPARLFVPVPSLEHKSLGTHVARGEPLMNTMAGAVYVPLAPAAGTIAAATEVQLLDGTRTDAVQIDVDPANPSRGLPETDRPRPAENMTDLIDRIRLAGIWASRHTSPDLLAQLHEAIRRPIDTVVCNLLDVEGGSALSAKLVREHGPVLIAGVMAVAKASGANRVWIVADPRLADRASVHVRKAGAASRIKVVDLLNDYPQANPTLLLYTLLNRRLRPDRLPTDVGAILFDGAAALAIGRIADGADETTRLMLAVPIEVRDSAHSRSHVAWAAVGTPLHVVLDALKLGGAATFRGGAALRDVRISRDAVVAGAELSIDAGPPSPPINPDPCIRCGWCVEACPVRINPAGLLEAAQDNDLPLADYHGLHACIECGICSYVCPSRLPLLGAIRGLGVRRVERS